MEDEHSCTTELFLRADGVVEFGSTDGPMPLASVGTWSVPAGTDDYNSKLDLEYVVIIHCKEGACSQLYVT